MENAAATVAVSDAPVLAETGLRDHLESKDVGVVPTLKEFASNMAAESRGGDDLVESYKNALMRAAVGVTSADYAIADTGTLVLITGGEQHRLISLVPPVHVCLLAADRILRTLADLIKVANVKYSSGVPPRAMTFITGPSRTADIELSLTLGVHGPRELHVLLYQSK
jgi:L-lactate dehydrogenase complex protein LldG